MAKSNPYGEIGSTGLSVFSGQIAQDFLRELRGKEAYKRYDEMRLNSPVVGALLFAIEQSIRHCEWSFQSDQGENDPRLELLNAAFNNMRYSWNDHIISALTMLPFGFSLFELVYERVDGRILWRKLSERGQDTVYRWLFDDNGGLAGIEQLSNYRTVTIPIEKLLLYRTRVERNNPEGRSILRTAWISYYYQKHMQQIEGIGVERDIAGMPVIHLPESANDTDIDKAEEIVSSVRNDERAGLVLPPGWEFELLSASGTRQFDTGAIIQRYDSRILMTSLAQFLLLGMTSTGTQALSKDMSEFFVMSVDATAGIIADTFTKFAIPRLLSLNGYDADGISLDHTPAGDTDVSKILDIIGRGSITLTTQDEVYLRSLAGLPELTPEEIDGAKAEKQAQREAMFQQQSNQFTANVDTYKSKRFIEPEEEPDNTIMDEYSEGAKSRILTFFKKQNKRVVAKIKELEA